MAVLALPRWREVRRRDAEGTLESVRALLDHLLVGLTDEGWRDMIRTWFRIA